MQATNEQLMWMYETMLVIREFEETMVKAYLEGKLPPHIQKGLAFDIGGGPVPGEMHLAAGQEPVAVGVCAHLRQDDTVVGTHRPHHFAIAKGVPLAAMAAEMFGKVSGLGRGKGGHMHLFDPAHKFSCSGIVGASLPPACGAALAAKKLGTDRVAVAFFGEGAANQGSFHESLNLASLWKLPVIFVCEDNKYAISVEKSDSTAITWNADRAGAYGMPGYKIEHNDPLAVFSAAGEAVARARAGDGPSLLEVKTDRYLGHFQGDAEVYRPKGEVAALRAHDPIPALAADMRAQGLLRDALDETIRARAHERVTHAYTFARDSAYPDVTEALEHVFVAALGQGSNPFMTVATQVRTLTMAQAIAEAIGNEMERDPRVFVMGEDIGKYGGIFGATQGLLARFGPDRIMDTPISETAFIGAATGAAAEGMRPIAELMFVDFFGVCMDQIYNHLAKNTYMSGGNVRLPVVLMTAIGGGYNDAAQHSQSLYGIFAHVPGLKIVVPSNAYDAKGLMTSAIRDDNPVMYFFHKGIMGLPWMAYFEGSTTAVPEESYTIPFGEAKVVREGTDVTVVTLSQMVHKAMQAADEVALQDGISTEVVDLRTLVPLDREAVLRSVAKTGRLLVADEDYLHFGVSSEIAALVAEQIGFIPMKAPVKRLGVPDVPIPYSRPLEQAVIPQVANITAAVRALMS